MTEAPLDIRRFETAQIILMSLGLIVSFILSRPLIGRFRIGALIGEIIAVGALIGLTLLVTRGRKNWARWCLLALYVSGVVLELWYFSTIMAVGHPIMTAGSILLRGVVLMLAFTPQSNEWLRTAPHRA